MANNDTQKEIEALRAQVAELAAERKAKQKEQAAASDRGESVNESVTEETVTTETSAEQVQAEEIDETTLTSQFQELIDTIDQELKEASPVTVLVVFALGVLVGRLLPR